MSDEQTNKAKATKAQPPHPVPTAEYYTPTVAPSGQPPQEFQTGIYASPMSSPPVTLAA